MIPTLLFTIMEKLNGYKVREREESVEYVYLI